MATFKGISQLQPLEPRAARAAETCEYKDQTIKNHLSSIAHIAATDSLYAIATSARLLVYSATSANSPKRTISRFKDLVLCCAFRPDAKTIAAGDASGLIQVYSPSCMLTLPTCTDLQLFDTESRSILRTLRGHTGFVGPFLTP